MSVIEYLDSEVFTPTFSNEVPLVNSDNIDSICRELSFAIRNQETIFVYGDYDMDGLCSVQVWRETFAQLQAKHPVVFKYVGRTHAIDKTISEQVKLSGARVVIICDTGSNVDDLMTLNLLQMQGFTTIVIDHHVFEGDYDIECKNRLTFNSYEERALLGECEVSGAYASLLVCKVLCERYFEISLPYNAKVFALASMYSDCVDMTSAVARALYASVCLVNTPGPIFFNGLNKFNYLFGRRFFSYIVAPKINGCFRMGRWDVLNRVLTVDNKFAMKDLANELQDVHTEASSLTKALLPLFERKRVGDIVLCVHEVTDETRKLNVRNFTGVIAARIAEEEKSAVVVLVRENRHYEGSFRDFYNRELLSTFALFCNAGGHPSAFGISIVDYYNFLKHLEILGSKLEVGFDKPYITMNSSVIEDDDDFDALALYNEYTNVKRSVRIAHVCKHVRLLKATTYYKYYQVGLPTDKPLVTKRTILDGNTVLIEPAICRGVELREME